LIFSVCSDCLCLGRKVSLGVRALDDIAGAVPLMVVYVTFIEASEFDQFNAQVGKTNFLNMNERLFG
jgi:hypothetical protein